MTDSDSGTLSQEEIAAQFVLPERRAKVSQLLAALDEDDLLPSKRDKKFLVKRTSGMGESGEDELYCICRTSDCSRFMIGCDNCNEWYHGDCIGVTQEDANHIRRFFCDLCRDKDPSLQIKYEKKKDKEKVPEPEEKPETMGIPVSKPSPVQKKHEKHQHKVKKQKFPTYNDSKSAKGKSTRRCGTCSNCERIEDCGRCDFCKDMKKYGGPNKIRQKCRLRQCLNFGLNVTGAKTKRDERDTDMDYYPGDNYSSRPKHSGKSRKRSESEHKSPSKKKNKGKKDKKKTTKTKQKRTQSRHGSSPRVKKKRVTIDLDDIGIDAVEDAPRQCLGPGCIEPAGEGSKYCSDECGMKLATNRIFEILPQRIRQWQQNPCLAEDNNKSTLEKIRSQQLQARQRLVELDLKHQELDTLIERAKHATISSDQDNIDDQEESELSVYCVTCGHEVNQRAALKHMTKCFSKYESQTSFGSIYKTRIEGNSMFCDYYNAQQQTYCKRLKVLCPEHSKEPKVSADEVCGCPLVQNVFEDTGEFCRVQKRKCSKHFSWEKLRRAEIDMERVRQWMLLDDLFEQERNIRTAMANRAGVLGLLLHQTIDHDPMNPMQNTTKIVNTA